MECILGSLWQRFVVFMTRKNNQPPLETQSESPFLKGNSSKTKYNGKQGGYRPDGQMAMGGALV